MMRRAIYICLLSVLLATILFGQEPTALFDSARGGDAEAVRELVDGGVPVDSTDRYGSTALLMATANGQLEVVKVLVELGADIDHKEGFYGADALGMALFRGHPEIAGYLLQQGADDRATVLQVGLQQGSPDLAKAAIEAGPIYESKLEAIKARSEDLSPELEAILAEAKSRPDPEPPAYTNADLQPYIGAFEGWNSDTRVEASVEGDALLLSVNGGEPIKMAVLAEKSFSSPDGEIEANFFGRAGSVEGIGLRSGEKAPESLRRSVAEPAGATAYSYADKSDWTLERMTVNWPSFRGQNALGIGDGKDTLTDWDLDSGEGVAWQTDLVGLGNSSPVVWGDRVFVTTASVDGEQTGIRTGLTGAGDSIDEEVEHSWRVVAHDKKTGQKLWSTEVGRGVPLTKRHFKATQANSTGATDGEHLVVVFPTAGVACLGLDGKIHWQRELGGLNAGAFTDPGIQWGYASSPVLYGSLAILQVDIHDGPYLIAWDLDSGKEAWRVEREVAPSWSTPALMRGPAGDELIVNGSVIHGYDPKTGEELWSLGPNSELVIAAPVIGDNIVYVSAGYPPVKPIYAVPAGTRGDLEVDPRGNDKRLKWSHGIGGAYMPTPLLYRGIYYVVHHNGRLVAYDAASGKAIYKSRFSKGGVFTGSPVAVNGKLYMGTEEGLFYVLEAGPEYKEIAVHDFGEPLMATPAVSEGVLFIRTPSKLIAIGEG